MLDLHFDYSMVFSKRNFELKKKMPQIDLIIKYHEHHNSHIFDLQRDRLQRKEETIPRNNKRFHTWVQATTQPLWHDIWLLRLFFLCWLCWNPHQCSRCGIGDDPQLNTQFKGSLLVRVPSLQPEDICSMGIDLVKFTTHDSRHSMVQKECSLYR